MIIKSVAAVGALGVGMGLASLIGAGSASAAPACGSLTAPPVTRATCLLNGYATDFAQSTSPAYNAQVLLYGTIDPTTGQPSGLGLVDQPKTFVNSLKTFASGPVAPPGPPPAAPVH